MARKAKKPMTKVQYVEKLHEENTSLGHANKALAQQLMTLQRELDVTKQRLKHEEQRVAYYKRKVTAQARAWTINAGKLAVAQQLALNAFAPDPVNFTEVPPLPGWAVMMRDEKDTPNGARTGRWSHAADSNRQTVDFPDRALDAEAQGLVDD